MILMGNWKMHKNKEETKVFLSSLSQLQSKVSVWVFPPVIHMGLCDTFLQDSSIQYGVQHVSEHEQGAFTGEVSIEMAKSYGASAVLIGHSERRHLYSETLQQVRQKVMLAKQHQMKMVLCVGETDLQREKNQTFAVIQEQLETALKGLEDPSLVMVAYEPVWAIGTGKVASIEQVNQVHAFVKDCLNTLFSDPKIPILYGGSVKKDNAALLLSQPLVDGALVGGACLTLQDFLTLIQVAEQC